ncbi:hypothetical protein ACFQJ5_06480 [Halomicroarcula sp. GCM10025324]|uniref:hypothetical protein n=1 Tax=Haloarcula TaxID=2237 RepID=UPI0023E8F7FB|nr:hypothetical protein [Halomicroarcula sp. ZS-22-S1]
MKRRKFLIGAGSLAAGSAAAMGTGAYSYAEADRTVTVDTTGDNSAYLKLDGDGKYVTDNNGELTINLGGTSNNGNGGSAFNQDAATRVLGVVTITNQGPNSLTASVQGDGGNVQQVNDVANVDLSDGEGIYFAVRNPTMGSGGTANIDVAVVESPNDSNGNVGGGTLTIKAE